MKKATLPNMLSNIGKKSKCDPPTIAIIGCGAIAEAFYLPAILKYPSVSRNVILVDSDVSRLERISAKYNIQNYVAAYDDILEKVDGVIIAVPNHLHYRISMDFLRRGVHVLCEKPLAENFKDATEMLRQAEASGVTICVNNTRRLFPAYGKIKDLIQNGSIGSLISINYTNGFLFQWPTASGFYFNHKESHPKGVLLDQGSHVLDAICWWIGNKPDVIYCENDSFGGMEGIAVVGLKSGCCTIEVKLSWLSQLQNKFKIVGDEGTIQGNIEDWNRFILKVGNCRSIRIKMHSKEKTYSDFAEKLVANFIDVVRNRAKPLIPGEEVTSSLELIEECYGVARRMSTPWYDDLEVQSEK